MLFDKRNKERLFTNEVIQEIRKYAPTIAYNLDWNSPFAMGIMCGLFGGLDSDKKILGMLQKWSTRELLVVFERRFVSWSAGKIYDTGKKEKNRVVSTI